MNTDRLVFVAILTPVFTGLLFAGASKDPLMISAFVGLAVTMIVGGLLMLASRIRRGRWPRNGERLF